MADITKLQIGNDELDITKKQDKMAILSYGHSTWGDFIDVYQKNAVVYCRASSNSNPATGSQTRMAFMAYVNNADNPTEVEFQYVRSVSNKTASQPVDQVFVYKLTSANGGTWTVTTRDMGPKLAHGTNTTVSYSNGTYTISATQPTVNDATLTIQRNGTTVQTFTANQSTAATANITVPTKTSDLTNDSGFLTSVPTASTSTLGGIKVGNNLTISSDGTLSANTSSVTVDSALSSTSTNPVQNKVVFQAIDNLNDDKISYGDVETSDITNSAVTTAKIANKAVTSAKVNWDDIATKTWVPIGYSKSTTSGTNLILTVNIPAAYQWASLKFALKFELNVDGWADVRCYDTSGNLIYGTYQGIFISGGTIDTGASENYTSVCSTKNAGHPYVSMQMEGQSLRFGNDGHYRSWLCRGGGGWTQSNFSFTANRDAAVGSIRFYTGGTAATGCELKVWGMIPS